MMTRTSNVDCSARRILATPILCALCTCFSLLGFGTSFAHAVDPDTRITQYAHTAWRTREGQIPGSPNAITQTRDGYIWIGTEGGLLRFDGYQFDRFKPAPGKSLHSQIVVSLAAGVDGTLLVGTALGLDIVRGNDVHHVNGNAQARIDRVLVDSRGETWFVRAHIQGDTKNPLCFVQNEEERCLGRGDGIASEYAVDLTEDSRGGIWIAGATDLIRWYQSKATTYTSPKFSHLKNLAGFGSIATGLDGKIYVGFIQSGAGLGLQELSNGVFKPLILPKLDGRNVQTTRLYEDRHGALWVGTSNEGVYRIYHDRVEHYRASDGLSGDSVRGIFEDREGVVWVTTTHGIDNFRDLRVRTLSTLEGLKTDFASGLVVAKDGSIWIGSMYGLNIIRSGEISYLDRSKGLPGNQVMGLGQDATGNWWMGLDQDLVFYADGRFRKVLDNRGDSLGPITAITTGKNGVVWAVTNGVSPGLLRLEDGKLIANIRSDHAKSPTALLVDSSDSLWVGHSDGTVSLLDKAEKANANIELGRNNAIRQILETRAHDVLVIAQQGLFGIHDRHVEQLGTRNGLPNSAFKSGGIDTKGDLWLYGETSLIHIPQSELDRWWQSPTSPLLYSSLSTADGLLISDNPFAPRVAVSRSGELWFSTGQSGVEIIDPAKEVAARPLPPIQIQEFVADHNSYDVVEPVRLPPLSRSLQIRFAGLSFIAPGDLRFRYRLDGNDQAWSEPTTNHYVFFENLSPGRYRFRVEASNRIGVWNPQEAVLQFVIAPAWYQTKWFRLMVVIGALSTIIVAFRLRVRSISATLNARFDERLAERTRMARELHDTFLQTVQGSKMVADDALVQDATEERMRVALGKLSVWLGRAVTEGRAALHALRASTNEQNQAIDSLRRALDELATGSVTTEMEIVGIPRQLHPLVRDELLQIGFEAIRNASQHAEAKRIRVRLAYESAVHLQVLDDGVGIAENYISEGRVGHFGLAGMRERVNRVKGRISIASRAVGGTEVSISIPGSVAYLFPDQKSFFGRWRRRSAVPDDSDQQGS